MQNTYKFKSGQFAAGLIAEYGKHNTTERINIYPQMQFLWMINKDNNLQASLTYHKDYPLHRTLSGLILSGGYIEYHGNSELRPSHTTSAYINYVFKEKYTFSAYFNHSRDLFQEAVFQSPTELVLIYKYINFNQKNYGIAASVPIQISTWLQSNFQADLFRTENICHNSVEFDFENKLTAASFILDNDLVICQRPRLVYNLFAMYATGEIYATLKGDSYYQISSGLRMAFFDNKLSVALNINDIFETSVPLTHQTLANQDFVMKANEYMRSFTFNVTYRFGGYTNRAKTIDTSRY